jgi:hypothetical protein
MRHRNPGLPEGLPVTGVVLAPPDFYAHEGARSRAVPLAPALLAIVRAQFGIDGRLATWNTAERRVTELDQARKDRASVGPSR